ncbi:MAG: hypothetical protein FWC03_03380 [Treponema sp.]|nr:hypothetical protein [Treponema sp.]
MKNKYFYHGIFAIILLLGALFISCEETPGESQIFEGQWAGGNIAKEGDAQWFYFTATASTHYIHISFGSLTDVYVQLYSSNGSSPGPSVGSSVNVYGSTTYISRSSLTIGNTYYIKVWPWSSSDKGTFQIMFNSSSYVPPNNTPLTENLWTSGNISSYGGEQWFSFTASASTQYIHFKFDTLNDLYVRLVGSNGNLVGDSSTNLYGSTTYTSRSSLQIGDVYYIRVWTSVGSGDYEISFNSTQGSPPTWSPESGTPVLLTGDQWVNGNISSSNGEQWYIFSAAANTQYVHVIFGTLTDLYVQLYYSDGSIAGNAINLYNNYRSTPLSLIPNDIYFIKVSPRNGNGTFQIAINTSTSPPVGTWTPDDSYTNLTFNQWTSGNISSPGGEQWFAFTASASTHYIHADFGTLDDIRVQLYDSNGTMVGSQINLTRSYPYAQRSSLISGNIYFIKVWPYASSRSGTFQITFNSSTSNPGGGGGWSPQYTPVQIGTANQWANGSISSSSGEQWFVFTASASTQNIHVNCGTITNLYVQLYDSNGNPTGANSYLSGSSYFSRSLTSGVMYYIRVTYGSGTGSFQIAYNTSTSAPVSSIWSPPGYNATQLTFDNWANGNISTQGGEQWFVFTATASTQYIHVTFGGLTDLYVELYDSSGNPSGSTINFYNAYRSAPRSLTSGSVYYIKVYPYSSYTGTYTIKFNASL